MEEIMLKQIILLSTNILILSSVQAAQLFVSNNGTGSDCSVIMPCKSIQTAVDNAQADDTIRIGEGKYFENITIPVAKNGLHIMGQGREETFVISAGGDALPKEAPPGVPIDVVFDVFSSNVIIEKLAIRHPSGIASKRDLGIFIRPPATNVSIRKTSIERHRTGDILEPTNPGSRGVFVLRATETNITKNKLGGNYEDHIHIPSSATTIDRNTITNATRAGIVIIQESATSLSTENLITRNTVNNSGSDGIQIQGDDNIIVKNKIKNSGNVAIKLCGAGDCIAPGVAAIASNNIVLKNKFKNNVANILDNGTNNTIN